MPSPIQYPYTDGARHSFASIEARFNTAQGPKVFFLHAVNYSRTRTRTMVRGNHPDPLGKTRGSNDYKCSVEMFLLEYEALRAALGGAGYGDQTFSIVVTYSENGLDTITDQILGCTLDGADASNAQGDDATMRKFDVNPIKILFGGQDDCAVTIRSTQLAA